MVVACAASFLLAFGVANLVYSRSRNAPGAGLATHMQTPGAASVDKSQVAVSESEMSPLGRYQLVVNGGTGPAQQVEMPVFSADDPRANWLLDDYATTPHEIIRELRDRGNDVQRRRFFLPMRHAGKCGRTPVRPRG
jgi:hypothetical protein